MTQPPLLVTCGLPYTNGPCHLGHLRTYVPADCYVRYMRRTGEEVVFVSGSDNHGTPIVVSAEERGISPRALSEKYHRHFDETFKRIGVNFDHFGMTDDPANHHRTREIVGRLEKNGYVYKQVVHQAYCPKCRRFLPDRYVEGTCPYCGKQARGMNVTRAAASTLNRVRSRTRSARSAGQRPSSGTRNIIFSDSPRLRIISCRFLTVYGEPATRRTMRSAG